MIGGWNYNFRGVELSVGMEYELVRSVPENFYDEQHRPNHFLNFAHSDLTAINETLEEDEFAEYEMHHH